MTNIQMQFDSVVIEDFSYFNQCPLQRFFLNKESSAGTIHGTLSWKHGQKDVFICDMVTVLSDGFVTNG